MSFNDALAYCLYQVESTLDPDLPWTDQISGEVDYEVMAEDLGVSDGTDGEGYDEDWD